MTEFGDVTYNSRRNLLGAIPVKDRIAYHLFSIDVGGSKKNDVVTLVRKSKCHVQHTSPTQGISTEIHTLAINIYRL